MSLLRMRNIENQILELFLKTPIQDSQFWRVEAPATVQNFIHGNRRHREEREVVFMQLNFAKLFSYFKEMLKKKKRKPKGKEKSSATLPTCKGHCRFLF